MSKYLYGAAVQGIQDFIFKTNKLKEIVGASELVEQVCTTKFARMLGKEAGDLATDPNAIVNAAGNIKYIFDDYGACQDVVRLFPKTIVEHAPGITISQAVVRYENDSEFENSVLQLEANLRAQRNKPMRSATIGLMGIERSRQTGLSVVYKKEKPDAHLDAGTWKKLYDDEKRRQTTLKICKDAFGENVKPEQVAYNIEHMTGNNDWLAIIHADGNGLGQVVQKIGTEAGKFKAFSQDLDAATKQAARDAFVSLGIKLEKGEKFPIRPIVLSGDDHTLICRADLAIPYVKTFIEKFEEHTKTKLKDKLWYKDKDTGEKKDIFTDGSKFLSACAGIAFIKSSYPFYYGYQLAEELCGIAKKDTKANYDFDKGNLPASCIMFHKVQDSFVTNYEDIVKRELTPVKADKEKNIIGYSLKFGPYYINKVSKMNVPDGRWTIDTLTAENADKLFKEEMLGVKTGLRQWLTAVADNSEYAKQRMKRLKDILTQRELTEALAIIKAAFDDWDDEKNYKWKEGDKKEKRFPIYDMLILNTINNQKTK